MLASRSRGSAVSLLFVATQVWGCDEEPLHALRNIDAGLPIEEPITLDAGHGHPDAEVFAPDAEIADAATCTDRAESATLDAGSNSTNVFAGSVPGAIAEGTFHIAGANGEELRGPVPVTDGSYSVELPLFCGVQTVTFSFAVDACTFTRTIEVTRSNCAATDLQITLVWDALGQDFELHLVKPGGRLNDNATDCTWTSCIGVAPDWGVPGDVTDNPSKDIDNVSASGVENIVLTRPENGTFTVLVEHWGSGDPLATGEVTILIRGVPTVIPIGPLASRFVTVVATIDLPSGALSTPNRVHDCTANWSGGCRDTLP